MIPVFDSSSLKKYCECPRSFYWRYVQDLIPKSWEDKEPAPLSFGTAIHKALEKWYSGGTAEQSINEFLDLWDDRLEDSLRTRERGQKILEKYFDNYNEEPFELLCEPEHRFCISLNGRDFAGKFDLVIEWSGMNLVMDHKTSSRMGTHYFAQFRPDIQFSAYPLAAQKILDRPFDGSVINVLYFTKTKYDFERDISYREPWELELTEELLTELMNEIESLPKEDYSAWRPNWTNCTKWYRPCEYYDLCLSPDPMLLTDTMFIKEQWNPLKKG